VSEKSTFYISGSVAPTLTEASASLSSGSGPSMPSVPGSVPVHGGPLTFNLPRFIPLLIERLPLHTFKFALL
jgi:hypothetical protein